MFKNMIFSKIKMNFSMCVGVSYSMFANILITKQKSIVSRYLPVRRLLRVNILIQFKFQAGFLLYYNYIY
jgi:hypothetical protein